MFPAWTLHSARCTLATATSAAAGRTRTPPVVLYSTVRSARSHQKPPLLVRPSAVHTKAPLALSIVAVAIRCPLAALLHSDEQDRHPKPDTDRQETGSPSPPGPKTNLLPFLLAHRLSFFGQSAATRFEQQPQHHNILLLAAYSLRLPTPAATTRSPCKFICWPSCRRPPCCALELQSTQLRVAALPPHSWLLPILLEFAPTVLPCNTKSTSTQ